MFEEPPGGMLTLGKVTVPVTWVMLVSIWTAPYTEVSGAMPATGMGQLTAQFESYWTSLL